MADRPRLLGAQLGFVGVLHTWGRQLQWHPHLHYLVPGGGLREDRRKWRKCRSPEFFLPVAALSAAFRVRMQTALQAAAPDLHAAVPDSCWRGPWVVHVQPAGSGAHVVRYLARYVKRSAISDERVIRADAREVVFRYNDSETGQARLCTLGSDEFFRRYMQHVPPPGQHRVRYFGWMHPAARRRRMIVETLLEKLILVKRKIDAPRWHLRCPHCEAFALVAVGLIPRAPSARRARSPP